jgi:predicted thioesterase
MYPVGDFEAVQPGIEGRTERLIDESLLTTHVGGEGIFATPAMIGLMELTSHRSVADLLPGGFTTVGYEVHVRHKAPSQKGDEIVVTSVLREVNGTRLLFDVACLDGETVLGEGTHKRAIVPARH